MTSALIVGCAHNVWDDVKRAQALWTFDKVYCVKLAGVEWPGPFDVWITLHPEWMDSYEKQRREKGYPGGYEIVAPLVPETGHGTKGNITRRITYKWPNMSSSASSGIYGAKVAIEDGHNRVVLAGIGMEATKHFTRKTQWTQRDAFLVGYKQSIKYLKGKVRSMSGLTMQDLGEPTLEWLQGDPAFTNSVQVQG